MTVSNSHDDLKSSKWQMSHNYTTDLFVSIDDVTGLCRDMLSQMCKETID